MRSSRAQSEGNYFDLKNEKEGKDRKYSYQDHKTDPKVVEIALALQPTFSNKDDLTKMPSFRISSSKFPFGAGEEYPIMPPPSPFRAIIEVTPKLQDSPVLAHSKSCFMNEKKQESKTSLLKESIMNNSRSRLMKDVGLTQANSNEGGEAQNSPSSHLVWDSTFEAIKTLETSMKLMLTPSTSKTKSRIPKDNDSHGDEAPLINSQTRGSTSSVASTADEDTPNKSNTSNTSNVSLTWDNSCEILGTKGDIIVTSDYKKKDLTASDTSMDIDEIITRVAPNLSRCDMDTMESIDEIETETLRPSQSSKVGDILDRNCHLRNFDRFSNVLFDL